MKEEEGGEWRIHYSELRFQTHFETCIFIIHTNMAENIEIFSFFSPLSDVLSTNKKVTFSIHIYYYPAKVILVNLCFHSLEW